MKKKYILIGGSGFIGKSFSIFLNSLNVNYELTNSSSLDLLLNDNYENIKNITRKKIVFIFSFLL